MKDAHTMTSVREIGFINSQPSLAECLTLLPPEENSVSRSRDFDITTTSTSSSQRENKFRGGDRSDCIIRKAQNVRGEGEECGDFTHQPDRRVMQKHSSSTAPYVSASSETTEDYQPLDAFTSRCTINAPEAMTSGLVGRGHNQVPYTLSNNRIPGMKQDHSKSGVQTYPYPHQRYGVTGEIPMNMGICNPPAASIMNGHGQVSHESDYKSRSHCYSDGLDQQLLHPQPQMHPRFMTAGHSLSELQRPRYGSDNTMAVYDRTMPHKFPGFEQHSSTAMYREYPAYLNNRHPDYPWMRDKKPGNKQRDTRRKWLYYLLY